MSQIEISPTLRAAVAEKCGAVQSQKIVWERAVAEALAAGASEGTLLQLLSAFKNARTLDACARGTSGEDGGLDGFLQRLRALVDESSFDLASWLAAFECVQSHLAANGRVSSASSVVGYVQCSAEFGGSSENRQSLPEIIEAMLEDYGFEGQEGCGIGPAG
ncbi:hypothetical protein QEH56_05350 [Pelagicoccus enzymogenes]|uniref:hypothetical protein n=1 Tax=Pelagicoccus enzymogenes TaxID=2773457 RepID=UPI00280E529A|nr:hypothetical protein [Pelagicoccus enzymogenes]MDQ8197563.1 hypothetical protein [Pelagicoccus enzymogenes]